MHIAIISWCFLSMSLFVVLEIKQAMRAFRSHRNRLNCLSQQTIGGGARRSEGTMIIEMGQRKWGQEGEGRWEDDVPQHAGRPGPSRCIADQRKQEQGKWDCFFWVPSKPSTGWGAVGHMGMRYLRLELLVTYGGMLYCRVPGSVRLG